MVSFSGEPTKHQKNKYLRANLLEKVVPDTVQLLRISLNSVQEWVHLKTNTFKNVYNNKSWLFQTRREEFIFHKNAHRTTKIHLVTAGDALRHYLQVLKYHIVSFGDSAIVALIRVGTFGKVVSEKRLDNSGGVHTFLYKQSIYSYYYIFYACRSFLTFCLIGVVK